MPEKLHNKLEFTFGGFHYEIVRSTRDPAKDPPPESLKLSPNSDFEHLNKVVKAIDACLRDAPNYWSAIELGTIYGDTPKPKGLTLCEVFANEEKPPEGWKINPEWEKAQFRQEPRSNPYEAFIYVNGERIFPEVIDEVKIIHPQIEDALNKIKPQLVTDPGKSFAMRGEVVQRHDGTKYVVGKPHLLAFGDKVICQRPHADNDFSYMCGQPHCRCMD